MEAQYSIHVHTFIKVVVHAKKTTPSECGPDKDCVGSGALGEPDKVDCAVPNSGTVAQSKVCYTELCIQYTKVLVQILTLPIQSDRQ